LSIGKERKIRRKGDLVSGRIRRGRGGVPLVGEAPEKRNSL